jgi:hypothetical protein
LIGRLNDRKRQDPFSVAGGEFQSASFILQAYDPVVMSELVKVHPSTDWYRAYPQGRGMSRLEKRRVNRNPHVSGWYFDKHMKDNRYELLFAEANSMHQLYHRKGLKEPMHQIETPLKPRTKYLWTVWACFRIEDEPHCTAWGAFSDWEPSTVWHPNFCSYRFVTPQRG